MIDIPPVNVQTRLVKIHYVNVWKFPLGLLALHVEHCLLKFNHFAVWKCLLDFPAVNQKKYIMKIFNDLCQKRSSDPGTHWIALKFPP